MGEHDELLRRYFDAEPDAALRRGHAAMQCASLLRETLWSMVSQRHMHTPGVDYAAYARQNLDALDRALAGYRERWP